MIDGAPGAKTEGFSGGDPAPPHRPARTPPRGRAAAANPRNRFESIAVELDPEEEGEGRTVPTVYLRDESQTIIAKNDSPDVGFDKSINPYRGCEHGCIYCYARPTHEFLGFSAGLDFETRIMVKEDAPRLLEAALSSPRWEPELLAMSGVTDPYQPVERKLGITRGCLEVLARFRNPVGIVTKNQLVCRDLDLLGELARFDCAAVTVSVTTLKPELARVMEPRTASPQARLETISRLAEAGVPVTVNVAPVIPGLTDEEVPAIIAAAAAAGADRANYIVLRLPHGVKDLFTEWLERFFPARRARVLGRIQALRGGRLNETEFGSRMKGEGIWAQQVRDLFRAGCRQAGLPRREIEFSTRHFRRPGPRQLDLGLDG